MAAILPILKVLLPHVANIATVAVPHFTKKPPVTQVDPVIAAQIEELQSAVTKNAESIHVLAEKLQQSIQGIDDGASAIQKQINQLKKLVFLSATIAVVSLTVAVWLALR